MLKKCFNALTVMLCDSTKIGTTIRSTEIKMSQLPYKMIKTPIKTIKYATTLVRISVIFFINQSPWMAQSHQYG